LHLRRGRAELASLALYVMDRGNNLLRDGIVKQVTLFRHGPQLCTAYGLRKPFSVFADKRNYVPFACHDDHRQVELRIALA